MLYSACASSSPRSASVTARSALPIALAPRPLLTESAGRTGDSARGAGTPVPVAGAGIDCGTDGEPGTAWKAAASRKPETASVFVLAPIIGSSPSTR